MILTLDVGNSQVFGGVFDNEELTLRFRTTARPSLSSDELGLFLRGVLRENDSDPSRINRIALCSVVPDLIYSLRSCCRKYFAVDPFILQAGMKTGLQIRYRNPLEVGADRIANAIGAMHLYPDRNLIIIDFGTATTFDVIRAPRDYLGGIIVAGPRIAMEALEQNTARLPTVEIVPATALVGRSTVEVASNPVGRSTLLREPGARERIDAGDPGADVRGRAGRRDRHGRTLASVRARERV